MLGSIVVDPRFNGPPGSANGGYLAGRLAAFVDVPAVEVRLSAPPPLERPLRVVHGVDGAVELFDGDALVAAARAGDLGLGVPATVSVAQAAAAADDVITPPELHPFPTCFACGPLRVQGDALRHQCGRVADGLVACPMTTSEMLPHDDDGNLLPEIVWAALDCPGAAACVPVGGVPHVLATFTARIDAPVAVGEPHVCVAWPLGVDGRKRRAGSAILAADGSVCAVAHALWIAIRRDG